MTDLYKMASDWVEAHWGEKITHGEHRESIQRLLESVCVSNKIGCCSKSGESEGQTQ
jgi:hypothetical protein